MDVVTYAAAVGAAKKYTDEQGGGGSSDAVKYTEQLLTSAQQAQARTNIGAANAADVYTKAQADDKFVALSDIDNEPTALEISTSINAIWR